MQSSPYEIGLLLIGLIMFAAIWLPQAIAGKQITLGILFIAFGALVSALPFQLKGPNPLEYRLLWEKMSELAVLISLFAAGLRIDTRFSFRAWRATIRLLVIAMPLTILAVAFLGWYIVGLAIPSALLLGAALAPTDPVMASDVQVGPPMEGGEDHVRFSLTSEAGLNDGLAFPFTYLAIASVAALANTETSSLWLADWLFRDLLARSAMGFIIGGLTGWALGKIIFHTTLGEPMAQTGFGYVALAVVLISYGAAEIVGGYGFISTFIAAYVVRRTEFESGYHTTLHEFADNLERVLMAILLILLGGVSIEVLRVLTAEMVVFSFLLILVVRPLVGIASLIGVDRPWREKAAISFFGIRGIGTIYYIAYAAGLASFTALDKLWAIGVFTIIASAALHGLTASPIMTMLDRKRNKALSKRPAPVA